jgi:CBS domain containing-hemolysin-like protein
LISTELGRIPEPEDSVTFGPLRLTVESMDGYRVALARVERVDADGEHERRDRAEPSP